MQVAGQNWTETTFFKVYNKGSAEAYYVLESKLVLGNDIVVVSTMTEFVENTDAEAEKQDWERKAC